MAYYTQGIQRIPLAFEALDVPVIAAVNGPAIGAGTDLACMCDLRIAAETARFAESFVKIGIIRVMAAPGCCRGSSAGRRPARWRSPATSSRPRRPGLRPCLAGGAGARADGGERRLAERIAVNPPQAVRATKRLLREGRFATLPSLLQLSATAQAIAHTTAEHREALARALARTKGSLSRRALPLSRVSSRVVSVVRERR